MLYEVITRSGSPPEKVIGAVATLEYHPGVGYPGDAQAVEAAQTGNVPPNARLYYMRGTLV